MNHIYKIIFNKSTGKMVVASELAKSQGKTSTTVGSSASQYRYVAFALSLTALSVVPLMSQQAYAASGKGGISQSTSRVEILNIGTPEHYGSSTGTGNVIVEGITNTQLGTNQSQVDKSGGTAIGSKSYAAQASTALGGGAYAYGWSSLALGVASYSKGEYSIAAGRQATTLAQRSMALGLGAHTTENAEGGISLGHASYSSGKRSIAIGSADTDSREFSMQNNTQALGQDSIALGSQAIAEQQDSIAIGHDSRAKKDAVAIGHDAIANAEKTIAIGSNVTVNGAGSVAIGSTVNNNQPNTKTKVDGTGSFSIGNDNEVAGNDTFVLGSSVISNGMSNSVFLGKGSAGYTDKSNSTGGTQNLNTPVAVTANQTTLNFSNYAAPAPKNAGIVSIGSKDNERRIQNVAAGLVSAQSTDAINGSQLHSTNQVLANVADSIKQVLGGNANVGTDGKITFTNIGGTSKGNIQEAIQEAAKTGGGATTKVKGQSGEITANLQGDTYTIGLDSTFKQSVDTAKQNAEQAKAQATQANQQATQANQKAGAAEQKAQAAEQKAGDAEQKAGQAETKAGAADTKATQAQQQAELAKNVADAAQTTAGKALAEANKSARVFEGDNKNVQVHPANDKITIVGGAQAIADTDLTNNNIAVIGENQGVLKIKLAKTLTGLDSITTNMLDTKGTVKIGGLLNANGGIKVAPSQQVDMGGNAIINVGKGTENNHAVNKQQLEETIDTKLKGFQVGGGQVTVEQQVQAGNQNAVSGDAVDKAIKANKTTVAGKQGEIKVDTQGNQYTVSLEPTLKNDITTAKQDAAQAKTQAGQAKTQADQAQNLANTANQAATNAQASAGQALNTANSSARKFKGDNVSVEVTPANGLINIKGGVADTQTGLTNNNIGVIGEQTGVLNIKLAKTLTGLESITTNMLDTKGTVKIGGLLSANGGLTVGANKTVDMGNNRITKVAQATEDTDAVNKKQLDDTITQRLQGVQTGGTPITIEQEVKPQSQNAVSGAAVDKAIKANKTTVAGTNGEIKVTQNQAADGTTYTIGLGDTAKGDIDQAKTDAGQAKAEAGQALTKANQADGKADQALQKANDSVREIQGDNQNTSVKPANGKMTIVGGAADTTDVGLSNNNIGVVGKGNGILEVKLAKALTGLDSVTAGSGENTTVLTQGGLTTKTGTHTTKILPTGIETTGTLKSTGAITQGSGQDVITINNGAITGLKDPTQDNHATRKKYVDDQNTAQNNALKDLLGGSAAVAPQGGKVTATNIGGTNQATIDGAIKTVKDTADGAKQTADQAATKADQAVAKVGQADQKADLATQTAQTAQTTAANAQDLANKSARVFEGDNKSVQVNPANGKITITGGAADTAQLTNNNIGVIGKSAGGQLEIKLAQDIKLGANGSLTTGDENGNKAVQTAKGLTVVDKGSNQQAVYDATGVKFQTPPQGAGQGTQIADSVVLTKDGLGFAPAQGQNTNSFNANAPKITKDGISAGNKAVDNVGSAFAPAQQGQPNTVADNAKKLTSTNNAPQAAEKTQAQNAIIDALKEAAKGTNTKAVNAADLGAATTALDGKLGDTKAELESKITAAAGKDGLLQIQYTDKNGNELEKGQDGKWRKKNDKQGAPVAASDVIAKTTNPNGDSPLGLGNVASGLDNAGVNGTKDIKGQNVQPANQPATAKDKLDHLLGNGNVTAPASNYAVNVGDLKTVAQGLVDKGTVYKGDNDTLVNRKLGETLTIKGGIANTNANDINGKLVDGNIGVVGTDGTLTVKLAKAVNLGNDGSLSVGMGNKTVKLDGNTGNITTGTGNQTAIQSATGLTVMDKNNGKNQQAVYDATGVKFQTPANGQNTQATPIADSVVITKDGLGFAPQANTQPAPQDGLSATAPKITKDGINAGGKAVDNVGSAFDVAPAGATTPQGTQKTNVLTDNIAKLANAQGKDKADAQNAIIDALKNAAKTQGGNNKAINAADLGAATTAIDGKLDDTKAELANKIASAVIKAQDGGLQTKYTDKAGNELVKHTDGKWYPKDKATGAANIQANPTPAGDIVAQAQNPNDSKTALTLGNIGSGLAGAGVDGSKGIDGNATNVQAANATAKDKLDHLLGKDAQNKDNVSETAAQTAVNVGDLKTVAQGLVDKGSSYQGDDGKLITKKLGEALKVQGGVADSAKLTNNNIGVVSDNGTLTVKLAKDINLGDTGSLTAGKDGKAIKLDGNNGKLTVGTADKQSTQSAAGLTVIDTVGNAKQQAVYDATGVKFQTPATTANANPTAIPNSVVLTKDGLGFAPAQGQNAQNGFNTNAPIITVGGINAGGKAIDNVGSAFDVPATGGAQASNVLATNQATLTNANASANDKQKAQNAIIDALKDAAKKGGNSKAINAADLGAATTALDSKLDDAKKALQDSGFYVKTPADATAQGHKITNGNTLSFNNGSNIEITRQDGELTIKTADAPNFSGTVTAGNLASSGSLTVGGDSTLKGNTTVNKNLTVDGDLIAKGGATLGGAGKTVQFAQGTTVDLGGNALTNVGAGTKDTDAVNFKQFTDFRTTIDKIIGEKKDQQGNLVVSDGQGNKPTDKDGKEIVVTPDEALRTYDAQSTSTVETNSIFTAIKNINEQGTKYIHVNGGESSLGGKRGTDPDQSQANGDKSTAIGFQTIAEGKSAVAVGNIAKALGEQALAIGDNAQATGKQSIAIGTGNVVTGQHSGAIGDPTVVTGNNSYSLGNNNRIATNDTYALGSDIIATAENSVALGNKTAVTAGDRSTKALKADGTAGNTTTAGSTGQVKSISLAGTNYEFAGQTAVGAVSVGASGSERRIQNVAAGEVSATSTDAVNGSQLFALAQGIGKQVDGMLGKANAGISSAMAMASMPQAYLAGKSMLTGGMATYNGEAAVAVGLSRLSDNGRWAVKISGSADTRGNAGGSIGAGFHF